MIHPVQAIHINRHRNGPRLYVFGFRAHHGPIAGGAAILAWRCNWKHLAVALGAYAATDWRDVPFRDCDGGHDTIMGWALRHLPPWALDLHHVRGRKRFNIGRWYKASEWKPKRRKGERVADAIRAEIAKCDVVCPTCHRLHHPPPNV